MRKSLNLFLDRFYLLKVNYSSKALDGGSITEANGRSQWFFSFRSIVSNLGETRPLLAGYVYHEGYTTILELGWLWLE